MSKLLSLLAIALFSFALVGCGDHSHDDGSHSHDEAPAQTKHETID